jgi:hypothetical protein
MNTTCYQRGRDRLRKAFSNYVDRQIMYGRMRMGVAHDYRLTRLNTASPEKDDTNETNSSTS